MSSSSTSVTPPPSNTHLHLPPNFSAFTTVEDAVATAAQEGVRVIGSSNFHDLNVYGRFEAAAREAGMVALFGLEFISVLEAEQAAGIRINDPENPGRAYLCGKGIPEPTAPSAETQRRMAQARAMNEARASAMIERLREQVRAAGEDMELSAAGIVAAVAERADVPTAWVVLQERHIARALQERIFDRFEPSARSAFLERLLGRPPASAPDDAVALQGELRSRLMKAERPAFVPETPIPFAEGLELVLGMGAIPCYPIVADGADPICGYEDPAPALVERILAQGIHAAELVPIRNSPEVVDEYVTTLRAAGIFVLAGTEHNTLARIPLEPRCRDGSLPSPAAREVFWEGTRIVAAHQHEVAAGRPGYVDEAGRLAPGFPDGEARLRWFAELGAELLSEATAVRAR